MHISARVLLVTIALGLPLLSAADDKSKSKDPHAKPSSYAPHPTNGPHVYGAPIGPAIVSSAHDRPTASHYNRSSPKLAKRDKKPVHDSERSRKSASQQQKPSRRVS